MVVPSAPVPRPSLSVLRGKRLPAAEGGKPALYAVVKAETVPYLVPPASATPTLDDVA